MQETNDATAARLSRVIGYAATRADYLDMREEVVRAAGAWDADPLPASDAGDRADAILAALRARAERGFASRLADARYRDGFARAIVGLVLP